MFKEKFLKAKEKIDNKSDGNNKKTIENLVVFVIILIVTIVIINYIWNGNKKTDNSVSDNNANTKSLASDNNNPNQQSTDDMANNLEGILSKIKGVGQVKVLITYSKTSQSVPMYSEDSSQKSTTENDSRRWYQNNK